jgi:alpha-L-rhamnosidase
MSLNGLKVGDEFLSPGWTSYHKRLNVSTFDVTHLLTKGANAIGAKLGDGWWRGKFGFMNMYDNYGTNIAVLAQLEVELEDGTTQTIVTDESWKTGTGSLRFADIYDGSTIDLNLAATGWNKAGFDDAGWSAAVAYPVDSAILKPRINSPVRVIDEFVLKLKQQSDRVLLVGEQNISGWVRLVVDGKKGQIVTVRHAEVLEPGEKLHTKALRTAKVTDVYVLDRDGRHVLEPEHTFHGFQFADVVTEAEVISAVAVAISSDNEIRGTFHSSDVRLNKLHSNVYWSARDNFVSIPTDCPQRDERLGWTGDAQAFAGTANTLFDAEAFWRSWLIDLEHDQAENGDVAAVVPDLISLNPVPPAEDAGWEVMGRAGWADAATIVPMAVYEHFGDKDVLVQQLDSMRRWTDALHNRRNGAEFLPTEFQFGDWCDPDAPEDRPWLSKVSADFVANSFFANTLDLMVEAEHLVGNAEGVAKYGKLRDELKANIWAKMGEEAMSTTAGLSMAIEFDIVPADKKQAAADKLAAMVVADNGRITTGFLGTPLILHAMSKNGHTAEAYKMLMRREIRSWLYQVDQNATTIWERWDAIREDGSIHSGSMDTASDAQEDPSMISFNHYAYGAVIDWVYRNVAGLAPVKNKPAYREFTVAPKPAVGFTFAEATIATRFGDAAIFWELQATGDLAIQLAVPFGTNAVIDLPVTAGSAITINGETATNGSTLGHGDYVLVVTKPAVLDYK